MKKQIAFLILLALLLFVGCEQKKEEQVPADVIPREQMIDIMVDAWFMESVIHNTIKEYERLEPVSVSMYKDFFEEHDITKEQFEQSIKYYMRDDETSQEFVQECSQRFEERKEELTGVADPVLQPQ
jgi:hypothetical protein